MLTFPTCGDDRSTAVDPTDAPTSQPMAETDPPDDLPAPPELAPTDRFATLDLADGETVIYDRDNPRAWLQSDGAVPVSSMS